MRSYLMRTQQGFFDTELPSQRINKDYGLNIGGRTDPQTTHIDTHVVMMAPIRHHNFILLVSRV
jgi:hypothetical protein